MTHRILVVDDEPAVTDLLTYNLRKALYEVRVAVDGRSALRLAGEFHPDLHGAGDNPDRVNADQAARIVRLAFLSAVELAQ